ncbi:MAG: T9SS type A sorting domain-containing protein [Bacteroidota bacterium]|jgi:hypothetical protein
MRRVKEKIIAKGMAALLFFTAPMVAGNILSVVRKSSSNLEVQLQNMDVVGGLQFSLRSSSDIVLSEPERSDRVLAPSWIVASYKPNDSTVNVLILSMRQDSLGSGSGSLLRLPYTSSGTVKENYVTLAGVLVVSPNSDSLGFTVDGLRWSDRSLTTDANASNQSFVLEQNYPNPFNPETRLTYRLNKSAQVRLDIYDAVGREVARLADQYEGAGEFTAVWNSTSANHQAAAGLYFARLTVDNESIVRKMILLK